MDAVTGLSGSGPAYVAVVIESLADGGVKMGLDRRHRHDPGHADRAGRRQAAAGDRDAPGALKDMVSSPGGTSIAGISALEEGGIRTTFIKAVERATQRLEGARAGPGLMFVASNLVLTVAGSSRSPVGVLLDHRSRGALLGEPRSVQPDRALPLPRDRAGAPPRSGTGCPRWRWARPVADGRVARHLLPGLVPDRQLRDLAVEPEVAEGSMRLTPLDIRQQQFTVRMFRGLDPHEVDAFLEDVAEDYETLLKENALLKEQLAALEERSRGLADREKALQETPVHHPAAGRGDEGQRPARGPDHRARGRAPGREVRGGRARRGGAHPRRHPRPQAGRRQLVEDLRTTLERYQRLLDDGPGRAGDARGRTEPTLLRVRVQPRADARRDRGLAGRHAGRARDGAAGGRPGQRGRGGLVAGALGLPRRLSRSSVASGRDKVAARRRLGPGDVRDRLGRGGSSCERGRRSPGGDADPGRGPAAAESRGEVQTLDRLDCQWLRFGREGFGDGRVHGPG